MPSFPHYHQLERSHMLTQVVDIAAIPDGAGLYTVNVKFGQGMQQASMALAAGFIGTCSRLHRHLNQYV